MSQPPSPKPLDTYLTFTFLGDFDRQTAYRIGKKVASAMATVVNGVITVALPTNPPAFADAISFAVNESQINEVIESFSTEMHIAKGSVRITMTPVPANLQTQIQPTQKLYS